MADQTIQTDIVLNTVGNVKGADEVDKRLRELDKNAAKFGSELQNAQKKANSETQKLTAEFKRLDTELLKAGYGLKQLGDAFGSEALSRVGQFIAGLGGLLSTAQAIQDAFKTISKSPLASGLLSGAGGAIIGSSIYDATIGKLQGTNTATILDQLGQFAAAGFNVDTLRANIQTAYLDAQIAEASKFKYDPTGAGAINSRLAGTGVSVKDVSAAGLEKAVAETEKLLQLRLTEGDVVGSTVAQVSTALDILKSELEKAKAAQKPTQEDASYQAAIKARSESYAKYFEYISSKDDERKKKDLQIANLESNVAARRAQAAQSLAADLAKLEQDYYANRLKAAQDFGIEAARAEQDHQRSMRRASEDHDKRLRSLAESRDALAIVDEVNNYETERRRAEEDYQVEASRRNEDYARQMADLEKSFRDQRQTRLNQYNQQIAELNDYLTTQRKVIMAQFAALIAAIENAFAGKTQQQNQQMLQTQIYGQTPNWAGPTATITQSFQFGNVSNPQQIRTIVYGAVRDVFRAIK